MLVFYNLLNTYSAILISEDLSEADLLNAISQNALGQSALNTWGLLTRHIVFTSQASLNKWRLCRAYMALPFDPSRVVSM